MDAVELELACPCGFENFERVVVQRRPHPPIVTDFVACVGCRSVYYSPLAPSTASQPPPPRTAARYQVPRDDGPGLKTYGGKLSTPGQREQSPEELRGIREAAARASKAKRRR